MKDYESFLEQKGRVVVDAGVTVDADKLNPHLFPFQRDLVRWALERGRAALFCDCGLGKTLMQLAWAEQIPGDVLILAPLAVAQQTVREGERFGIPVNYCRDGSQVRPGVTVTNYEMLEHFDVSAFAGVVLDESSILKAYDGKTCQRIIEAFAATPYRLACTATPAPNDHMELGNHSAFLGIMSRAEMLAMYFTHDGGDTSQWRLKRHAEGEFWKWVCSWGAMVKKPSDLGYSDDGYHLPALNMEHHVLAVDESLAHAAGMLFAKDASTLEEQRATRRATLESRVAECARYVNASSEQWLIWCELNDESDALCRAIPGAVQVRGSDTLEEKERALIDFTEGRLRVLITKPKIAGFGMNWQNCHNVAFVGVSHSYEQTYQAIRRCWRFGQRHPVNVHVVSAETEGRVVDNLRRKERDAERMAEEMVAHMRAQQRFGRATRTRTKYRPVTDLQFPSWLTEEAA